jgi:hypothetical protein
VSITPETILLSLSVPATTPQTQTFTLANPLLVSLLSLSVPLRHNEECDFYEMVCYASLF